MCPCGLHTMMIVHFSISFLKILILVLYLFIYSFTLVSLVRYMGCRVRHLLFELLLKIESSFELLVTWLIKITGQKLVFNPLNTQDALS